MDLCSRLQFCYDDIIFEGIFRKSESLSVRSNTHSYFLRHWTQSFGGLGFSSLSLIPVNLQKYFEKQLLSSPSSKILASRIPETL